MFQSKQDPDKVEDDAQVLKEVEEELEEEDAVADMDIYNLSHNTLPFSMGEKTSILGQKTSDGTHYSFRLRG